MFYRLTRELFKITKLSLMFKIKIVFCSLITLTLFIYSACITIYGITDDYNKLSDNEKEVIHHFIENDNLINGHVYTINANQLKNELKKYSKSLVYIFSNGCTGKSCYPMNTYIDFASKNKYQLFLVMAGFNFMNETLIQGAEIPYYAIHSKDYNIKRRQYIRMFENELLSRDLQYKTKEYLGNLYFFNGNQLIKIEKDLLNTKKETSLF